MTVVSTKLSSISLAPRTRPSGRGLTYPKFPASQEAPIIPRHPFGVAIGEMINL